MANRTLGLYIKISMICIALAIGSSLAQAASKPGIDMRMVPVLLDGEQVRLAVRVFRPDGKGSFPTLILHHGSTGRGDNPDNFTKVSLPYTVISYFVDRGWSVVLPSRRGRNGSEGLYDEGFTPSRHRYSFEPRYALPGADRALGDIDAITNVIRTWPFVDKDRLVIGGISRGGISSVAHAGQRPNLYRGVINFVGGWVSDPTPHHETINQTLFNRGVPFGKETLWLYASDDRFYSLENTRAYFEAFKKAGGKGVFFDDFPDGIGHRLPHVPEHWGTVVEAYLGRRGLILKKAPSAVRFTPDPELPPTAFLGNWEGHFGRRPVGLRIHSVSSGWANGEYLNGNRELGIQEPIEGGVLEKSFRSGASISFFVGRKDVLIATFRGRGFSRALLFRVDK